MLARVAAVLALAAVAAALLLLLHSLRSKPAAKVVVPPVVKVLIPEGKTRPQIAQIATAAGLTGSYRAASRHSPLLNPAHYGAPSGTRTLEGFLFPATYDMDTGAAAEPARGRAADRLPRKLRRPPDRTRPRAARHPL